MAFQAPPTFVDGAVLSASQLNILSANQNYLSGISSSVNPGFREIALGSGGVEWMYYSVIHAHEWLYIRANLDASATLRVYASDDSFTTAIWTITDDGEVEESKDITAEGLTVGSWIRYGVRGTGGAITLRYFSEDDGDRTA